MRPTSASDHHLPEQPDASIDRASLTVPPQVVRTMLGAQVDVETFDGTVHGTLLSCTRTSLWLVDGETDLVVALAAIRDIHAAAA